MILKKIESIKDNEINKITLLPGIEEVILESKKMFAVTFYVYTKNNKRLPLMMKILSNDKSFKRINMVELYNNKYKPAVGIELDPNIPDDKLILFITKLLTTTKFKKVNESFNCVDEYLYNDAKMLMEVNIAKFFRNVDPATLINGVILALTVFMLIRYYIIKIRNMKTEYETAGKKEEEINQKLFLGQKYDDPAFKMYLKLQNFIKFVALGKAPAVIICGPPGTSKTYIVRRTFHFEGLKPGTDYRIEKGGSLSVSAVYDLLYLNRDRILILDDFDTPLKNVDTINMLKAITDSYDKRILSISREKRMSSQNQEAPETPSKFEYKGKLIIITNLDKKEIDRALLSRAPAFEVKFSIQEIITALEKMITYINPEVDVKIKQEVLSYIMSLYRKNPNIEIDFRAFKNSVDARVGNPLYWKEMVHTIVGFDE